MKTLLQDLRYGARNLVRNPGFAVVAMLTLALGVGVNTTVFSVINNTLLKPLAFPEASRLVLVWETSGKGPDNWNIVSAPNFWDFQRQSRSFENMAIFDSGGRGYNLSAGARQEAEQVSGLRVSAGFFSVLGVKPFLGRTFLPEEEMLGRDHEVVLSYGLWKRRYGGDPALLGRMIRIDSADFTVIGVMPREFAWQFWSGSPRQLWVPVGYTKTDYGRDNHSFLAIARLKPGVSVAQARAEMEAIATNVSRQYPQEDAEMGATVSLLEEYGVKQLRRVMLTLFAAVAFVLLIACVNVANLLLARGATRQKEFAIRRALGAAGSRIARQLLTESVLLALAGGAAGLLLAALSNRIVLSAFQLNSLYLPLRSVDELPTDGRVFAFALIVSGMTGLLFGLAPAWSALRAGINSPLQEGGRNTGGGRNRLRHILVASEVALAMVVLSGAGLMIKSMTRLLGVDPGLNPKNVLVLGMSVPQAEIYVGPPGLPRFCQDIDAHVGSIPGVLSASAVGHLPFEGNAGRGFQIEGQPPAAPGEMPGANYSVACPNYFRTMGIPVLKGREFQPQDSLAAPAVIVINETMARTYWAKQNPVGRAIRLGGSDGPRLTIVGVVGDVHQSGLDAPMHPQFMRPYMQAGWPVMSVVVRTNHTPATFAVPVKKALAAAFPDWPVSGFQTMEEVLRESTSSRRFPMLLLSTFSLVALSLAAVGIVGVVAHSVTQRTHEIGLRMALGARSVDVLRLIINSNMAWVLAGLAAGTAGSAGLTRLLSGLLYGVHPLDPMVLAAVSGLLTAVALFASYLPARRAAQIDPMAALRIE